MRRDAFLLPTMIFLFATFTVGQSYSVVVAYGDSYSDNGNVFRVLGVPGWPYWQGRASNGPVAVERLAAELGNVRLLDEAWIGATTGVGDLYDGGTVITLGRDHLPGMTTSFNATKSRLTPAMLHSGLFVLWGGINDFSGGLTAVVADRAVANLAAIARGLQAYGARSILVAGMPDLGLLPYYFQQGPGVSSSASFISNYFNRKLASSLPSGAIFYDTSALFRDMVAHPANYGLTEVQQPCYVQQVCFNPYQHLFWDNFHPTAHVHEIIASQFAAAVGAH